MPRKRARGEGSVFQRSDGRWASEITLPSGRTRTFYGRTQADVVRRLQAATALRAQGASTPPRRTVKRLLTTWLAGVELTVRPRAFLSYRSIVERHITPALGGYHLDELDAGVIREFLAAKLHAGLSPSTVVHIHAVLRQALGAAQAEGLVLQNAARLVKPPTVPQRDVAALPAGGVPALLAALKDHRYETLFLAALATGARQSELLAWTWPMVDFATGSVRIVRSLQRYAGEYHLDGVKSATSRRTLALPPELVTRLRAHRVAQREAQLRAGPLWLGNEWDLVFTTERGAPLYGPVVTKAFQAALAVAGLPQMRFHELRHGFAGLALEAGAPLKVVSDLLGHSTIGITSDLYVHLTPETTREASERVGMVMFGRS